VLDRIMRVPRHFLMVLLAVITVGAVGFLSHGLLRSGTPLPSVEECDCIVNDLGRALHGRLDVRGQCQPVPCRICSESGSPSVAASPSKANADDR
jgi:hypothetical protein